MYGMLGRVILLSDDKYHNAREKIHLYLVYKYLDGNINYYQHFKRGYYARKKSVCVFKQMG